MGSIGYGNPVFGFMVGGEGLFEFQRFGTRGPPPVAALQHFLQRMQFLLVVVGPGWERLGLSLRPPK